jgi:hypothetical protein
MTDKVIPYDNSVVKNDSKEWMLWCEATSIAKWHYGKRKEFLEKIKANEKRVETLKKYLTYIWNNR